MNNKYRNILKFCNAFVAISALSSSLGRPNQHSEPTRIHGFSKNTLVKRAQNANATESSFYKDVADAFCLNCPTGTVKTPNGSSVTIHIMSNAEEIDVDKGNSNGDAKVPEARRISPSTIKYNCHSYAWYSQSTSNEYWMDDPTMYYTDGSYCQAYSPKAGDIVCYYSSWGTNLHSGLITSVNSGSSNGVCGDSNLVNVRSKWGSWGVYEHRGDQCPYTSAYGGSARSVKHYRRGHAYDTYTRTDSGHVGICSCGNTVTASHTYNLNYSWKNLTSHIAECVCGAKTSQSHAVSSTGFSGNKKYATCLLCNGNASRGVVGAALSVKLASSEQEHSCRLSNGVFIISQSELNGFLACSEKWLVEYYSREEIHHEN